MFTEKCENIAFFLPAPKNFFRHKKVPNRQKPTNPPLLATLENIVYFKILIISQLLSKTAKSFYRLQGHEDRSVQFATCVKVYAY